jgi:hypothetical protein
MIGEPDQSTSLIFGSPMLLAVGLTVGLAVGLLSLTWRIHTQLKH